MRRARNDNQILVMTPLILLVTFAWIVLVCAAFVFLPARQAVIVGFLSGWLFLPVLNYPIAHLPDYSKITVTCLGILFGILLFDARRVLSFRPRWFDLPMLIWCISPFASSLANGLGVYDGLSSAFAQSLAWGVPYLIGRVYFNDLRGLRELASGSFIGGVVYIPLCLYEIIEGPELHHLLYGFYPSPLDMEIRFGGWRPMVFMYSGLMVGFWMVSATVIGFWLWRSGALSKVSRVQISWLVVALSATTVLVKSVNAWIYLILGFALYFAITRFRTALPMSALIILIPIYLIVRATGFWGGDQLLPIAQTVVNADKAQSLRVRFESEVRLSERAREQPIFGWAGWGRNFVRDEQGNLLAVTDSLWIIAFGQYGFVGLTALVVLLLMPIVMFLRQFPIGQWTTPTLAPATALVIVLLLYAIDNLINAMTNPIFMLAAGGIVGCYYAARLQKAPVSRRTHITESILPLPPH